MMVRLFRFILPVLAGTLFLGSCEEDPAVPGQRFIDADRLIESALTDSLIAGAVLLAGNSESILYHQAYGYGTIYEADNQPLPVPEEITPGHLFDIASLSKIFATTYGLMLLHSRGLLDVDDPVSGYLQEFDTEEKHDITIRHLLTHSSGLIQWFPTYYIATNPGERLAFVSSEPLISGIGEQRRYSDLGFMILADLIETITGESLEEFLEREIYRPLGLSSTLFNPDPGIYPDIAATSYGNPFEKKMVYDDDFGYTVNVDPGAWDGWRDYVLRGEVNDGNAYHTHGGIAGHAGLFSTADELYRLASLLLTAGQYNDLQLFTTDTIGTFLTPDRFGHGLGFMMEAGSLHAAELPDGSFGHTGFTGTNFVIIPEKDLIIILLANRQHFGVNENGYYPDLRELRSGVIAAIIDGVAEVAI